MNDLCVLITNHSLCEFGGSEMYVRDLATRLLERGHQPVVYSQRLGKVAELLLHATIPVVDDLNQLGREPDIIHCQHSLSSAAALLRFPNVPGVYICHDWAWYHDAPPRIQRIRKWIAVDRTVASRLTMREGRNPAEIHVLSNGVDLRRFRRRDPLPRQPQRALVFSNYMLASHIEMIRSACQNFGISVDAVGRGNEFVCDRPEEVLGQYDLVFAKGRCAWEAMSCGAALIICDIVGVGDMVSTKNLDKNASRNFGRRLLRKPLSFETISAELARYDAADATRVCELVRERVDLDKIVDQLIEYYRQAIADNAGAPLDVRAELHEMSRLIAYCDRSKELWQTNFDAGLTGDRLKHRVDLSPQPPIEHTDAPVA